MDDEGADVKSRKQAPLAMDRERFKTLGYQLVDEIAALLEGIPGRPLTRDEPPSAVRAALGLDDGLPDAGMEPGELLRQTARGLIDHSLFNGHPRFFGYITSSPAPIGILGDFLAAAVNANVGSWTLSPAATEIEVQTVRWIAELIGYPADCDGLLVSGGNMANMVALFAARAANASWNVRVDGMAGSDKRLAVYASAETHTWIQKACDLAGLGTAAIRWIPTDSDLRIDLEQLAHAIDADRAGGILPLMAVGTAGSVSTGAVDPLPEMARVCRERSLWFHVDGAYGGFAAAVGAAPSDLRGLAAADSVAVDPHKWLYAPLEAGCVLVRDPGLLAGAFAYHPPYYHFDEQATNFVDRGPQNSRGFRALKVWLALRQVGAAGYRAMIGENMRLSQLMAGRIRAHADLQLITQSLSIATFQFVPADLAAGAAADEVAAYLNVLNRAILDATQRGGDVFVSNAVVRGRFALRACIVNFHTSEADVQATVETIAAAGRKLDAHLRPEAGLVPPTRS